MIRKFALILAALILSISIVTSYCVPVNAMPISPIADGLYETFSKIFGYALGTYKDLNELGYNYQLSQMKDFIDSQINGEAYTWENNEAFVIQDINKYENFVNLMQNSLATVQGYNTGIVPSSYFDALNKRSYTSSGTMATVTLEQKLSNGLALLETMGKVNFEMNFENFRNTLFGGTDESGAVVPVTNLATNYELYEALTSSLMTMSAYDSTNEWFTPVGETVFDYESLNTGYITYNDFPIYFYYGNLIETNYGGFDTTSPVYYFILKYSESSKGGNVVMVSDSYFEYYNVGWHGSYNKQLNDMTLYYSNVAITSLKTSKQTMTYIPQADATWYANYIYDYFTKNMCGNNFNAEKISSVGGMAPAFNLALDAFFSKDITAEDVSNLADDLAGVEGAVGTDLAIKALTDAVAGITVTLPDSIVDGKNDVVEAVSGLGDIILTLPKAIWKEFADTMEAIQTKVDAKPWEGEYTKDSNDIIIILDALLLLILIIVALLKIFIHCLAFIINIFAIPASTAFLPDDMLLGLNYIKTLEIPGIGLSVYDFMMGLVYILIVFFAIRVLRSSVDRIRVPKQRSGGLHG